MPCKAEIILFEPEHIKYVRRDCGGVVVYLLTVTPSLLYGYVYTMKGDFFMQQTRSMTIKIWVEGAIIAALAMALSVIPINIGSSFAISLGMIPLTVYSLRRGAVAGVMAGVLWGLLHFLTGQVYFLKVSQVLIEYVIAFPFAGLAGLFSHKLLKATDSEKFKTAVGYIILGSLVGCLARYFWHFIAGVIFWGDFALWGLSPIVFSLIMNSASAISTAIVVVIATVWIYKIYPKVFIK